MLRCRHQISTSVLAAVVLLGLAACGQDNASDGATASPSAAASGSASASATPSASPSASVKVSSSIDSIKVTGAYGKQPTVSVKAPFAIDKTRVRVLSPNERGAVVTSDETVRFNYFAVNARTGKTFDDSFKRGQPITFPLSNLVPGFNKGLVGQRQGSRVLLVIPGSDGYDSSGGQASAGIAVGDTLIFVVDIVAVPLSGPQGSAVTPAAGLPTVTDQGGVPSITVPKTTAPTALKVQPLIKGTGAKVAATDTITFNYRWVTWSDGKLLEETYTTKPADAPLSQLLPGMQKGLVGQTVGSRVLLVIPPEDGYPQGNATPKVNAGETLVMVVDLLFTTAAQ